MNPLSEEQKTYENFLRILRRSTELLIDDPVKEEIFSVERLEQHATYLATEFKLNLKSTSGRSLVPELRQCEKQLYQSHHQLGEVIRGRHEVSPAVEWFLDNFYIIEEQLTGIKRDLPKSYYKELPKLTSGELAGYPRVYAMALSILAHTDSRLDEETLKRYLIAYQKVTPLQIGEIWAIAITLRIALVEHLTRLSLRFVSARHRRDQADIFADQILEVCAQSKKDSSSLLHKFSQELQNPEKFNRAFIVQLIQRLRDQDPDVWPIFDWLENQLKKRGTTTVKVTQLEHHRQAADQVTVGNIITSMRLISSMDWHEFFEEVSPVDTILAKDPSGSYLDMDFATRDRYRHAIERISKRSDATQIKIAKTAVDLAFAAKLKDHSQMRYSHVGFYLTDEGVSELEAKLKYRPTFREKLSRFVFLHPTLIYLGSLSVLTFCILILILMYLRSSGGSILGTILFSAPASILASEFALNVLNHYFTFFIRPKLLPKMNTELGIPSHAKTMVVIPTLYTSEASIRELLEKIEIHHLANTDKELYFALLGDFSDAQTETLTQDSILANLMADGIQTLNAKYAVGSPYPKFYGFNRRRRWNPSEGHWIGWERKRGKLLEFNQLLRGNLETSYFPHSADLGLLKQIEYVITLDTDTRLPRNGARKLVGTILHPLNQPFYNETAKRVTKGYGILQPRISVDLESSTQTRFSRIFSGNTGLDPYTTAVSDVYQDLFSEGSFTGKGLYVVDAFEEALANRGPENSVLSHDLFEGCYARTALVTDIELYDDYPTTYEVFSKRLHRWTRGDWQIAQWLFSKVPDARGKMVENNLPLISRWKIFDNLRRSLVSASIVLWLLLGWTVLPGSPVTWTLPIFALLIFPIYAPLLIGRPFRKSEMPWSERLKAAGLELKDKIEQIVLTVAFLLPLARAQLDAIVRTLYRKLISKRKLLEWVTFAQVQNKGKEFLSYLDIFCVDTLSACVVTIILLVKWPESLIVANPFLGLWLINPFLKFWLQAKGWNDLSELNNDELNTFREYARRSWHFFETFIVSADHFISPDNYQEIPKPVVAHRTSPTNIGLQLLSMTSAYDLGYLGTLQYLEMLDSVFTTLAKLKKIEGHFLNWYDTQSLEPLRPEYISTVDSGNLAGHLFTLKQACLQFARELSDHAKRSDIQKKGLSDTLAILKTEIALQRNEDYPPLEKLVADLQKNIYFIPWSTIVNRLLDADDLFAVINAQNPNLPVSDIQEWLNAAILQAKECLRDESKIELETIRTRFVSIADQSEALSLGMNFRFLFNKKRKVFCIGYNVTDNRLDNSYYDLLASESRLASFMAIAKGDVPEEHWFMLGRKLTRLYGKQILYSWTASMFEYLMPTLVMRTYHRTLLEQTNASSVECQIAYGKEHSVPWGVSEAGYNARDLNMNYQYGPFGVPGLGLKRGLGENLVVSPYSTLLSAMVDPVEALANLKALIQNGMLSRFGFYESVDYTPDRLPKHQSHAVIRSFMTHHQGMSLVSLNNLINDFIMQDRFHADARVKATELLLQERIPLKRAVEKKHSDDIPSSKATRLSQTPNPRFYSDVNTDTPRTQILSNGTYSVMLTSAGSGYSRYGRLGINRWREDWTRDPWGSFFYIRDRATGKLWSPCYQPTHLKPDFYEVTFSEDKVDFVRRDGNISTHTEVIVSPEDNVELRRISISNHSDEAREFDVTSFMETVLANPADDDAHPAFSNLFVQTQYLPEENALLGTRRRRSAKQAQVWAFHGLVTEGETIGPVQYETDRARFLGRGKTAQEPYLVKEGRPLSNTVGSVLDPIFALQQSVKISARGVVRLTFTTGATQSREEAVQLADKYHDHHIFAREAEIAWTQSQVQLRHLNISGDKAHLYQRLAGRIVYSDPSLRPRPHLLSLNTKTQTSLWAYGIGGDLPILLARIADEKDLNMVRELLHAHEYLRLKGVIFDLVFLNEQSSSYLQLLQESIQRQIRVSGSQGLVDKPGGVFLLRSDLIPEADLTLLKTISRITLNSENGSLTEHLKRRSVEGELPPLFSPAMKKRAYPVEPIGFSSVEFFNGLGGFTPDGQSYQIRLSEGQNTPAPWSNVIANADDFGFLITESGSGYTWSDNSRENRLTSWSNDAVTDPPSESIYLRDEQTGEVWTPTPLPIREKEDYLIQHTQGLTQFEHTSHGIAQELQMYVPTTGTVKINRLILKNLGAQKRQISVTHYVEWVLGFKRASTAPMVITEHDQSSGLIFARNPYNNEFAKRIAFVATSEKEYSFTCDRKEFLGRNGNPNHPAALERTHLSGRFGAGLDPCAAMQTQIELAPGEEKEIIFLLGQAQDYEEAKSLAQSFKGPEQAREALERSLEKWDETLGAIEVKTPDPAMNIMVNRWLLYQTLACRVWARSAFYQSGGAFGFRDQLQDVMALVYSNPQATRAQILKAAARQFKEGDVQHWWHPPTGRGVRTQISDDLLWLPYVVSFYINATHDCSILDEQVSYLEAEELKHGQEDAYIEPRSSDEKISILEHCARAIDRSLKVGSHGLPLMGAGDWNDGMNRVGHEGLGESVWVGWFLYATLNEFIPLCEKNGLHERASVYKQHVIDLKQAIETNGWDGNWYRRAFFDDGTALGSANNEECRIDSIAQSWAVLSKGGDPERARRAMAAVDEHLVIWGDALIKLFTPPFDQGTTDPGYIKGYVPGVRENGGQYTHAAIWTLMAYAELGDGERATELYSLLNPIHHASSRAGSYKYKVEPYVVAADIYGMHPHVGRGGWTWYTGSASWMYRAALESILGFKLRGNVLRIKPCIPKSWNHFEIIYRCNKTEYKISVENRNPSNEKMKITLDDKLLLTEDIPLVYDGKKHKIHIQL
jgi:cyclic beta-1,2-glucan synthetase